MLELTGQAVLPASNRVVPGPAAASALAERPEVFTVTVGVWAPRLAWTGIYAVHVACAAYCVAAAMLLTKLEASTTAFYLDFYQATLPTKYFPAIALVHCLVGAIHVGLLALPILRGLYHRILWITQRCKRGAAVYPQHDRSTSVLHRTASAISDTIDHRVPWQLRTPFAVIYRHVFSRTGVLGVEFRHHDTVFLVREVVETVLQSVQAYHMSRVLARPVLNRFFVATLVVNCWATPVLHHVVTSKPLQRLLARLCDMVLDLLASVGVPVILSLSYVQAFDPAIQDFPYSLWYDDVWFVTALKECPVILFGSWLDAISRLVFSIGLISSLTSVKRQLTRRPESSVTSTTAAKTTMKTLGSAPSLSPPRQSRLLTSAHRLLVLYGFAVLGVHLHVELRSSPTESCLLPVRPWLVTKPACSLVEINCWRDRHLTGNASDFVRHIGALDALSLTQITFRHCHHVEMQASLTPFQNLIGIKLYNVTLAAWADDAALQEVYHINMRYVFCIRTTFANDSLPAGLLSYDFPRLLNDLEFSVTNLAQIPDDLDQRWPPGVALCIEFSQLTAYPSVFTRAQFQSLTLAGNHITSVPATAFETAGSILLSLTGNPITHLPLDCNASRISLSSFNIDSTKISFMPPWITEWLELAPGSRGVVAGRTPWCEHVVVPAKANSSVTETQRWLEYIDCEDKGPTYGVYPLSNEANAEEVW